MSFLDNIGLSHLWDKIKNLLSSKASIAISSTTSSDTDVWIDTSSGVPIIKVNNNNTMMRVVSPIEKENIPLVSFSTATDEEITNMINAFYNDEITIDDIKSVWSVGDTRDIYIYDIDAAKNYIDDTKTSISISAESRWIEESHHADTYSFVILDFEHDDLTTSINGHTKALITIQMTEAFHSAGCTYLNSDSEIGVMNSINFDDGTNEVWNAWKGDGDCGRYLWCNYKFRSALPTYIRNLNKTVKKLTSAGGKSSTINTTDDYVFFLSEVELFNTTDYSYSGEGELYSYYSVVEHRYKPPTWSADGSTTGASNAPSSCYWTRSPYKDSENDFVYIDWGNKVNHYNSSNSLGIVPALCL